MTFDSSHIKVFLTQSNLEPVEAVSFVSSPDCGAISLFLGTTRETEPDVKMKTSDENKSVENLPITGLHYEVYEEMAVKLMTKIATETLEKGVTRCYLVHRTGYVPVGEASILIAASSLHRNAAHSAVMQVLNQVKAKVPVWKKIVCSNADSSLPNGCWSDKSEAFWLDK